MVPAGHAAKVFREPSLSSAVAATLSNDTKVYIDCTVRGDMVTNSWGTSSDLWDHLHSGYIPDVNVDTGSSRPVARDCP